MHRIVNASPSETTTLDSKVSFGFRPLLATSLLLALLPSVALAQDHTAPGALDGQVLARGRREPLAGMAVVLSCGELERQVYSDADGRFAVADLEPCRWLGAWTDGNRSRRRRPEPNRGSG